MRRTRRTASALLSLSFVLTGPALSNARIPAQLPGVDITDSQLGRDMAAEAAARYESYGVGPASSGLKTLDLGDDGLLIAPADAVDLAASTEWLEDDQVETEVSTTVGHTLDGSGTVMAAESDAVVAASAYWSLREDGCFTRWWVDSAYMDTCYYIFKLINDESGSKDYWSLRHWSTVGETAYGLRSAWVNGTRPTGTTWQNWTDWDLGTDRNANCSSTYIDVTFIVTVGANFDACETWDMTKSANGSNVSYKVEWKCNCWPWMGEVDREVAYSILVNVSQGATPRWTLGMGMAA